MSRPVSVTVAAQEITISGYRGTTIPLNDVTEMEIIQKMPVPVRKINGFNLGPIRRGHFNVGELGRGRLYVRSAEGHYLLIHTYDSFVIIQGVDEEAVQSLHQDITNQL